MFYASFPNSEAQIEWAVQLMQYLQLLFVKVSFIVFFRRIFNSTGFSSKFGIATAGMMVLITAWSIALVLTTLFACKGNPAAWWSDQAAEKCLGLNLEIAFVLSDCIIDVMIIVMPLPMVCHASSEPLPQSRTSDRRLTRDI